MSRATTNARFTPSWPEILPEILTLCPPARLLVPLSHRGGGDIIAKPPGTFVHAGDKLAIKDDELSHVPLAPLDGTLGLAREAHLTTGRLVPAVELMVAPEQSPAPIESSVVDEPTLVGWIDRMRNGGVGADRIASPDLIDQLHLAVGRGAQRVVCTILDADAGMRLNALLAVHHGPHIVLGLERLRVATGAETAQLVVEAFASPTWADPVRKAAEAARMEIIELTNDYPQSDPTLIHYTLGAGRLRPGASPATLGVILLDAAAALAVGDLLAGKPALTTPAAVNDHLQHRTHLLNVPIGTQISDLLAALHIPSEGVVLRGGDLLRDIRLTPDAVLGSGELTLHVTLPEPVRSPQPCVRCGWCLEACPTRVQPAGVLEAAQRGDYQMAERAGLHACIECGLCTYVCPSRLPLLESIRWWRGLAADTELRR
jgi:electron transport complex protein RnfC